MKHKILERIFEPRAKKLIIAASIPILIITADNLTGYCTEDMCFSGIYRLSGNNMNNYFLLAHIELYIAIALFSFVAISLIYGAIKRLKH